MGPAPALAPPGQRPVRRPGQRPVRRPSQRTVRRPSRCAGRRFPAASPWPGPGRPRGPCRPARRSGRRPPHAWTARRGRRRDRRAAGHPPWPPSHRDPVRRAARAPCPDRSGYQPSGRRTSSTTSTQPSAPDPAVGSPSRSDAFRRRRDRPGHGDEPEGTVAAVATDELGDEVVGGAGQQRRRVGDLGEASADAQHGDLVAELDGLVDVVGDEHDRLAAVSPAARRNSSWSWSRTTGSTALNGSSISSTGGSAASARATPTRCCWPPESWAG